MSAVKTGHAAVPHNGHDSVVATAGPDSHPVAMYDANTCTCVASDLSAYFPKGKCMLQWQVLGKMSA